jgi:hypothetical protein
MNIETQFCLTPETVRIGVRRFWQHRYFRKRELSITAIFLCLLIAFGFLKGRGSWPTVLFIGIFGLSFWIARFRVYFALLRKKMEQLNQLTKGMAGLLLTDTTLVLTGGQIRSELKWEQLKGAIECGGVLVLLWGGIDFSIIPLDRISQDALLLIRQKAGTGK